MRTIRTVDLEGRNNIRSCEDNACGCAGWDCVAEAVRERISTSRRLCIGDSSQGDDRPLGEHIIGRIRARSSTNCEGRDLTANREGESCVDLVRSVCWIECRDDVMSTFDSAIGRINRDSLCRGA